MDTIFYGDIDSKIAKDMKTGKCCSWCGNYFIKEHGYPVLCHGCYGIYIPIKIIKQRGLKPQIHKYFEENPY